MFADDEMFVPEGQCGLFGDAPVKPAAPKFVPEPEPEPLVVPEPTREFEDKIFGVFTRTAVIPPQKLAPKAPEPPTVAQAIATGTPAVIPAPVVSEPEPTPVVVTRAPEIVQWNTTATDLGFSEAPTLFPEGTILAESGKKNYQASRKSYEEMADVEDACQSLEHQIAGESRYDDRFTGYSAKMDGTGEIVIHRYDRYAVDKPAFNQLCSRLGIPFGGRYLAECPPGLRAANFNHWSDKNYEELVARTRLDKEVRRSIFAIVTPKYAEMDLHRIAKQVRWNAPSDAKAEIRYDGRKGAITLLYHAPSEFDCAVGDHYKAGVEISSDDTGAGSLRVKALLYRAVCRNLTTVCRELEIMRQIHKGQKVRDNLGSIISRAMDEAHDKIRAFRDSWQEAGTMVVPAHEYDKDMEPAIAKLVQTKVIEAPVDDEELIRRIRTSYWKDPEPTVRGLSNAVTRTAHEYSWSSPWVADELQDQGGALIHNRDKTFKTAQGALKEAEGKGWSPNYFTLYDVDRGSLAAQPVFLFQK